MTSLDTHSSCSFFPRPERSLSLLKIAVDYLYSSATTGTLLAVIEEPGLRQ